MQTRYILLWLLFNLQLNTTVVADEHSVKYSLEKRVTTLELKIVELEKKLSLLADDNRWKDPSLWTRLKKGMSEQTVLTIIGEPVRKEQAIFNSWYYHKTSKLHSFIWFDEGQILGWEPPR